MNPRDAAPNNRVGVNTQACLPRALNTVPNGNRNFITSLQFRPFKAATGRLKQILRTSCKDRCKTGLANVSKR